MSNLVDTLSHSTRRQVLRRFGGVVGAVLLVACTRKDDSASAPVVAAQGGPAQTPPAPTAVQSAASLPTAAVTPTRQLTTAPIARGGTVTVAVQDDWTTFDSTVNTGNYYPHVSIFDPLLKYEPDDNGAWHITPGLLDQWQANGNAITVHLRPGVTFHDGSAWQMDTFKWNFERATKEPKALGRAKLPGLNLNDPLTVVDDSTARIHLINPSASALQGLCASYFYPMSKANADKVGLDQALANPVGTGPFKFVEWRRGDRVIVQRNENYWQRGADDKPLPYLDGTVAPTD